MAWERFDARHIDGQKEFLELAGPSLADNTHTIRHDNIFKWPNHKFTIGASKIAPAPESEHTNCNANLFEAKGDNSEKKFRPEIRARIASLEDRCLTLTSLPVEDIKYRWRSQQIANQKPVFDLAQGSKRGWSLSFPRMVSFGLPRWSSKTSKPNN